MKAGRVHRIARPVDAHPHIGNPIEPALPLLDRFGSVKMCATSAGIASIDAAGGGAAITDRRPASHGNLKLGRSPGHQYSEATARE